MVATNQAPEIFAQMVEFSLLEIMTRRFQPLRHFGGSCAERTFAGRSLADRGSQGFHFLTNQGGGFNCLLRCGCAELLCLGRDIGKDSRCLVAVLLKSPLDLLLGLLASIS